jgi:alkaline phosphatase D
MPEILYVNPETNLPEKPESRKRSWKPVVRYPDGHSIDTIEGAVPGSIGEIQILYRIEGNEDWLETDWRGVDPARDYTRKFVLPNLNPNSKYQIQAVSRGIHEGPLGQSLEGSFETAPRSDQRARVLFTVSTGQAYGDQDHEEGGYKIYPVMSRLDPDFFVHTGDILYYDSMAKNVDLARWHWARMYSLPTNVESHKNVPTYFIKDDHDTWQNDCWPGMDSVFMGEFTFEQGQAIFLEQTPIGEKTWRTYRWGKDLQVWLVEGRDFRSPNTDPDGPDKTIWGKEQMGWFKRTVEESDATYKILVSPTPVVGPDRDNKHDNHSNDDFKTEGDELRKFIASQGNMVVVCGDRHWQYVSVDPETNIREYSCGPASNEHAGGWDQEDKRPEHIYLNVTGGFLAGIVEQKDGKSSLTFRHYSVDGEILNEEVFEPVNRLSENSPEK